MRASILLTLVAILLNGRGLDAATQESSSGAPLAASGNLRPVSLEAEPILASRVEIKDGGIADWVGELCRVSRKAVLVFGRVSPDSGFIEKINGKPAHVGMKLLAEQVGGKWEQYEDFYVLCPADWERHAARPVRRESRYKELTRKIRSVHSAPILLEALQKVGKENRVAVMIVGTTASVPARRRMLQPCIFAAEGRSLDAFMRAITAVFGDPWERFGTAHALSFTGEPMTLAERQRMSEGLAAASFAQSLSPAQEQQMRTEEGLLAAALSPAQQASLAAGTQKMRAAHQVGVGQLRLTRIPANDGRWDTSIRISIVNPDGTLTRIGAITAP